MILFSVFFIINETQIENETLLGSPKRAKHTRKNRKNDKRMDFIMFEEDKISLEIRNRSRL